MTDGEYTAVKLPEPTVADAPKDRGVSDPEVVEFSAGDDAQLGVGEGTDTRIRGYRRTLCALGLSFVGHLTSLARKMSRMARATSRLRAGCVTRK